MDITYAIFCVMPANAECGFIGRIYDRDMPGYSAPYIHRVIKKFVCNLSKKIKKNLEILKTV